MQIVYLDYQATTPLAPEVARAMRPWAEEKFANPHSPHRLGREAAAAIDVAREQVLRALHATLPLTQPRSLRAKSRSAGADAETSLDFARDERLTGDLYFTSGATEAANWALKGALTALPSARRRIITLATEHACVLDTARWLEGRGVALDILPVGSDGIVDLDEAARRIDERTALVAAMLVNNEIGVVQPIAELSRLAHDAGALFFCDAVQGYGRVPLPVGQCDMIALSAHKVHGPKGIGALWLREGVAPEPLLHGGGQEGGVRSGTLSPALCVGFGEAARLMAERRDTDAAHVESLWAVARDRLAGWTLNGAESPRYKGNLNLRRDGLDVARLMSDVRQVAFSAGSACASGSGRPSHVLAALGLDDRAARSSIRLGFGRYTSRAELDAALDALVAAADAQRLFAT